jgi:signal transduction histidine kinase
MGEENSQIVLIFIVSAAIVVLIATSLILFLLIYQKRIVTQENRLQKLKNERQQLLLKATIEGQERERQRLAKDLHDGIGSLLSGLSLNLKFQKSRETANSEQAKFLTEACELVDEGIVNVRAVSHNLMPATLEKFGLRSAMKECIQPITQTGELGIEINTINEPYTIPKDIALGLLRIFQELLQNMIKHSGASEIAVELVYNSDGIKLHYTDNGKGFDFDKADSEGIGIKNMESRVQALEGSFHINKTNQSGFEAEIEVPLVSNENEV